MKTSYIDCHCHIFNKDVLINNATILRLLTTLPDILISDKAVDKKYNKIEGNKTTIENIVNFLKTGLQASEASLFNEMDAVYAYDYAIVPLMFDLEECFNAANPDTGKSFIQDLLEKAIHSITEIIDAFKDDSNKDTGLLEELKSLLQPHVDNKMPTNGFEDQITQLTALKQANPDKIYPFFAIDPRREGVVERFKTEIAEKGTFTGVKLYPPNGYSPTDKVFIDSDFYGFCAQKGIPIITHNSFGGFASLLDKIHINGDIYDETSGITYVDKDVDFVSITKGFDNMVLDKGTKLNHPKLWRTVLEKHNDLKLDLAHFGHGNDKWQTEIYNMLCEKKDNGDLKFPNLYVDLSCYTEKDQLKLVKEKFYDKAPEAVKRKFLYGSDFYLNLLTIDSLSTYLKQFKDVFGDDFPRIALHNPKVFLNL